MAIDDPRNISARFGETDQTTPTPRLKAGESIARARLGGGGGPNPESAQPLAPTFESMIDASMGGEESQGEEVNPLLKSLGTLLAPAEPQPGKMAPTALSILPATLKPLDGVVFGQPQVAGALALGGVIAGCAVGAFTLGLGGALMTFAFEAIAFAGGVLVSRAGHKQLMEVTQRLLFDATHDGMTGLLNRKTIMDGLDEVAAASQRTSLPYAVLMTDLDHFKHINDTYGHQAGDEVLRAVAGRMRDLVRQGAREGRYGGEEFLMVIPEATTEMAYAAAERIRRAVANDPVTTPYGIIPVTVSIGVASSDRAGNDPQRLLRAADEALYRAKRAGRNRVEAALVPA